MSIDFTNSANSFELSGEDERLPFWVLTTNYKLASAVILGCACAITALSITAHRMTTAFYLQKSYTDVMNKNYRNLNERYLLSMNERFNELRFDPRRQAGVATETKTLTGLRLAESPDLEVLKETPSLPTENLHDVTLKLLSSSVGQNYRHVNLRVEDPATRRFVDKLKRQDFEVFLGQSRISPVVVQETEMTNEPKAIAILQDKSASTLGEADREGTEAISAFIQAYANPSRIRLWAFSDSVIPLTAWTYDKDQLLAACSTVSPKGGTALYDSSLSVIDDLSKRSENRVMVLLTDGADTTKRDLLQTVINRCRASNIAVYVVGLRSSALSEPPLKRLAADTGGKYLVAESNQDLLPRFKEIARSIYSPAYRLIALVPANSDEPLRIEVGNSKLTVPPTPGL